MPNVLDYLALRQIGHCKTRSYVEGKRAVLDMLEYEAAKPTINKPCEFSGEPRAAFLVDFSPNMLRAASTHGDHSVRITNIETGKCTHVLTGHPRTPWCLAFNPLSNDILASGCLAGEVRIWDLLGGGSEVCHMTSGTVITSLAFHPSGQLLVFATINCIYYWDWNKPTPCAVTKTNHEYERIMWLRFDPYGKYLYTGIANNTTLHREGARNVINIRANMTGQEGGMLDDADSRSVLFRNRMRYNRLMQRFRSFQQNQHQRADYPESIRPRSPVHEENLNLARQYANQITERVSASVFNSRETPRQRPSILRDYLLQRQGNNSTEDGSLTSSDSFSLLNMIDREREGGEASTSRGWGRYQPSFFTTPAAADNDDNSGSGGGDGSNNIRRAARGIAATRVMGRNRPLIPRLTPYSVRGLVRGRSRLAANSRSLFNRREYSSLHQSSSSSIYSLPGVDRTGRLSQPAQEPDHHDHNAVVGGLEPDEFEILPVDQSDHNNTNTDGEHGGGDGDGSEANGNNSSTREYDRMSASEMAQRLEQQLRQLRRELFHLTQRNMDINSAILTLPSSNSSHRSGQQSSSSTTATARAVGRDMQSSHTNPHRSAFRTAGSALSRSIFSRSGSNNNNNGSTSSSSSSLLSTSLASPSFPLSSPFSTASLTTTRPVSVVDVDYLRSFQASSNIPTSSGLTRSTNNNNNNNTQTRASLSSLATSLAHNHNYRLVMDMRNSHPAFSERFNSNLVPPAPSTLTDSTSQTFGAMNLPEQLDQSTDMTGLESDSLQPHQSQGDTPPQRETCNTLSDSAVVSCSNISEHLHSTTADSSMNTNQSLGLDSNRNSGINHSLCLSQSQQNPGNLSTNTTTATTACAETQITRISISSTPIPSVGILRSALTAPIASTTNYPQFSLIPPFPSSSLSSSSSSTISMQQQQSSTNCAFMTLNSNTNNASVVSSSATTRSDQSTPISTSHNNNLSSSSSLSHSSSTLNDNQVFRSIANLRNRLSDIIEENRLRSQMSNNNTGTVTVTASSSLAPQPVSSSNSSSRGMTTEDNNTNAILFDSHTLPTSRNDNASEHNTTTTMSERGSSGVNHALRASVANVQRRLSDVLNNIRSSEEQQNGGGGDDAGDSSGEEVQRLRDMEFRFLSQTSQVLSQTTAYWTDFLERNVREMNQRISELERRLETNRYLISSNPFSHQRPGRPQDALMSSLFRNRTAASAGNNSNSSNNTSDRPSSERGEEGADNDTSHRRDTESDGDDPSVLPTTSASTDNSSNNEGDPRRAARGQIQRNQLLLDFLEWRGSRAQGQSQRNLSFNQSDSNELRPPPSTSSPPAVTTASSLNSSLPPPVLSSSLTATSSSSSSSSLSPSLTGRVEEGVDSDEDNDNDEEERVMMQARAEQSGRGGRVRDEGTEREREENELDGSWLGLHHIHLHPDYSSSILDDTINRPNEAMQHILNRTIAGALDREEQAVASNIIPKTHRIQRWEVNWIAVPDISKASANIVVEHCKLHNDASCDISKDGTTLATFVPNHRGFPDDNILGVFSLRKETFAQCLYTKSFGPNAISVSISPANHYVMVGLAARRYYFFSLSNKMVGQVYKLVKEKAGEKSMKHVTDLFHPRARGVQVHISVNFGRWLPGIGEGIVYGTNRGDLHFCRPGPRRVPGPEAPESRSHHLAANSRRSRSGIRSSIATQTKTVSIRRSASTQTQHSDHNDEADPSRQ